MADKTLQGEGWATPGNPVSTPLGLGVIEGIRFDERGTEWWSVAVLGHSPQIFRPDEIAPTWATLLAASEADQILEDGHDA